MTKKCSEAAPRRRGVFLIRNGIAPALAARPATSVAVPSREALGGTAPCQEGLPPAGAGGVESERGRSGGSRRGRPREPGAIWRIAA